MTRNDSPFPSCRTRSGILVLRKSEKSEKSASKSGSDALRPGSWLKTRDEERGRDRGEISHPLVSGANSRRCSFSALTDNPQRTTHHGSSFQS